MVDFAHFAHEDGMIALTVRENEAGQRFDKLLGKYLRDAPAGFLYKMLRKKQITLNGKKATGQERTQVGDRVCLFFSEETYRKFAGGRDMDFGAPLPKSAVLYEDAHVCALNKPAGTLSQKSKPHDHSLNEQFLAYLLQEGAIAPQDLATFCPAVCNRLDRNTSGLTLAGKTLAGLQELSAALKDRSLHKDYLCPVLGKVTKEAHLSGFLQKDERRNQVTVTKEKGQRGQPIETHILPLWTDGEVTLLQVRLITGRTHQIRAHLAFWGHAIVGDSKYGSGAGERLARDYGIRHQLLHAYQVSFPICGGALSQLSEKTIRAPLPAPFAHFLTARKCPVARIFPRNPEKELPLA